MVREWTYSGIHSASYPGGTGVSFPWCKAAARQGEVKNVWSYISTPLYVFMAWDLVNHRDNFTL
jgi:hypothetical protein